MDAVESEDLKINLKSFSGTKFLLFSPKVLNK